MDNGTLSVNGRLFELNNSKLIIRTYKLITIVCFSYYNKSLMG